MENTQITNCNICGAQLINGVCPSCYPQMFAQQPQYVNVQPPQYNMPQSNGAVYPNNEFVEADEKFITAIGNNVAQNFFTSGFWGSNGAVLINKRFYYKGKAYLAGSSLLQKTQCVVEWHSKKFCVKADPIRQSAACKASGIWDFLLIAWFPLAETVCAPKA